MKRLKLLLLGCILALTASATSHHVYFNVLEDGTLNKTQYEDSHGLWDINVEFFVYSASGHISMSLWFDGPEAEYEVYRLHADGEHHNGDETDPLWNMQLQPAVNPQWCYYDYSNGTIHFIDTFDSQLLIQELSTVNTIRYRIYDRTHNNDYTIQFNNAFGPVHGGIITSVDVVKGDNKVTYYDLQGHSSTKPFNGINIVKVNGVTKKAIY